MESHDSLPYIDTDITESDRNAVNKLIQRELTKGYEKQLHPSLTTLAEPKFSALISQEIARQAAGQAPVKGIDTSRYEAPDEPSNEADIAEWRRALQNAYMSSTYLAGRRTNLTLLEEFGKNAWLIGNYELEGILRNLEAELANIKSQTEEVNKARKMAQEGSKGELLALEDTWKKGIGKMIEVQVATQQLRDRLEERRQGAAG